MINRKSLSTPTNISKKNKWWKNKEFLDELDNRYCACESGKEKGYTLAEVDSLFEIVKMKRNNLL